MGWSTPILERMEVVSCDDRHVGNVEQVMGGEIALANLDAEGAGHHPTIPMAWVVDVDAQVHLNCTRDAAEARLREI